MTSLSVKFVFLSGKGLLCLLMLMIGMAIGTIISSILYPMHDLLYEVHNTGTSTFMPWAL